MFLVADGFDKAILGYAERCGEEPVVIYDYEKCVKIAMRDGLSREEAIEHIDFNTVGAWVGEQTPMFMHRATREQLDEIADEESA